MKAIVSTILFCLVVISVFSRPLYVVEGNTVTIDVELIGGKARIIRVDMLTPSAVKVVSSNKETLSERPGYIVREGLDPVRFKVNYKDNIVEITTSNLIVDVEENGLVRIFNRASNRLVVGSDKMYQASALDPGKFDIKQRLFLSGNEQLFGWGQSETDRLSNLRGQHLEIVQNEVATASPIFYSDKGYAVIWDHYSKSGFTDTKGYLELSAVATDEIEYLCIYGPEWDKIIAELRTVTGKAPMLPRRAFGFLTAPADSGADVGQYHLYGMPADQYPAGSFDQLKKEHEALLQADFRNINASALPILKSTLPQLYTSESRACLPTRSALPGVQQYGVFTYTGAVKGCWNTLKSQITSGINFTLAGQPYWSTNIGGNTSEQCSSEPYAELMTRWYQFAAFNPVFQLMETGKEPWKIAQPGDPYFQAIADAIRLRYRLLPYIYSVAHQVYAANGSMVRPLYCEFPDDPKTLKIDQQFMFGPSIMVCPVTAPGVASLQVYFPGQAFDWVDFRTGKRYPAGSESKIDVSIASVPVFVKSGSVIPLAPVNNCANDSLSQPLELRVYPGPKNEFVYYEDQNDGQGYTLAQVARIGLFFSEKEKALEIGSTEGTYPGLPVERMFKVVLVDDEKGLGLSTCDNCQTVTYKGKRIKVKLE